MERKGLICGMAWDGWVVERSGRDGQGKETRWGNLLSLWYMCLALGESVYYSDYT